jgi:hypothetical protein
MSVHIAAFFLFLIAAAFFLLAVFKVALPFDLIAGGLMCVALGLAVDHHVHHGAA